MAARLSELRDADRNKLESYLVEFDRAWTAASLDKSVAALPAGASWRLLAIQEMVKIDLEKCWWRGRKTQVEDYLKRLPELGTRDTVSPELLVAEFEARAHAGFAAEQQDFAKRFPRQAATFQKLLLAVRPDSKPASRHSGAPTVSHDPSTSSPKAAQSQARVLPPQFGRYQIRGKIESGGMGTVYLAYDSNLQRQVALKVPRFFPDDDPEIVKRFFHEAQLLAAFQHPNICSVFDVGAIDGVHYLTMPYLAGQTLAKSISSAKPFDQTRAAEIVRILAGALDEAHKAGIVHRDLKPANVMMTTAGEPVLIDFGLARRMIPNVRTPQAGSCVGTAPYMSPEQVRSEAAAREPGCDVYGLGAVLYELLTGRPPFQGSVDEVFAKILREPPQSISKFRSDVNPALVEICNKAMAKAPEERHGTMAELEADLGAFLQSEAPKPSTNRRGAHTALFAFIGAVAAALLLAAVLYWATDYGTIEITVNAHGATVTVDGNTLVLDKSPALVRLRVGPHHFEAEVDGEVVASQNAVVQRGGNQTVRLQVAQRTKPMLDPQVEREKTAEKLNFFLALQKWNELKMERDLGETTDIQSVLGVAQSRLNEIRQSIFDHGDLPEDFRTSYIQLLRHQEGELTYWQTILSNQFTAAVEVFKILTDTKVREDYMARAKALKDEYAAIELIAARYGARTDWQPLPRVTKVLPGSIAEKMGIRPGDFFFSYNNVKLYRKLPNPLIDKTKADRVPEVEVAFLDPQRMLKQTIPGGTLVGVQIDTSSAEPPITVRLIGFAVYDGYYVQVVNLSQDTVTKNVAVSYTDSQGQLFHLAQSAGSLQPLANTLLDPSKIEFTVAPNQRITVQADGYEPRVFDTNSLIRK
jgi:hypothetical protein